MPTYHVLFDHQPEIMGHVCALHRAIADELVCIDEKTDGECEHVQYAACTCGDWPGCDHCLDERAN